MFLFHWPILFLVLPLPWLLRGLLPPARRGSDGCLFLPFAESLDTATQRLMPQRNWWLLLLLWLLLVGAAARPQWLGEPLRIVESGRSLILAVDVSGSMATTDLDPIGGKQTRLDVIKRLAGEFIAQRRGDRIGLILFGSNAYLQAPLTFDRKTVRALLEQASIGVAGRETAIGNALGLAIKRLRHAPEGKAVLVLMTDGANTAGIVSPHRAADFAAASGLRVYTIGVGAAPATDASPMTAPSGDPMADLDEALLREIATRTGGRYFRATDRQGLRRIYRLLNRLEPVSGGEEIVRPVRELYPWPLGGAFAISLLLAWQAGGRRLA